MNTDSCLLRRFVEARDERAFTELVQRHVGLVYSVALRRVGGDAHLAEDVTQTVFNALARKARALRDRESLGGWLYLSANAASAAVVRSEQRRKARELAAHTMQTTVSSGKPDPDWNELRPVIDQAVLELKEQEREAIVQRFFEQRSFAEVGVALSVTEEAARKRVDRALEKLRDILARQGVTSTAASLGVALAVNGAGSAPVALAGKIAGQAFATSSGGVTLGGLLGAGLPTAAVLALGGFFLVGAQRTNETLRAELSGLMAENAALASLHSENVALGRTLAEVERLRSLAAAPLPEPPPRRSVAAPVPARATAAGIVVSPQGTLAWNGEPVKLAEFIRRLREINAATREGAQVRVSAAPGASYSAVAYVIEEARKAGLEHFTVESAAIPDEQKAPVWWF